MSFAYVCLHTIFVLLGSVQLVAWFRLLNLAPLPGEIGRVPVEFAVA